MTMTSPGAWVSQDTTSTYGVVTFQISQGR